jgi:hypothetical protein
MQCFELKPNVRRLAMKKFSSLFALLVLSASFVAPASAATSSWSGTTTVTRLYAGDTVLVQFGSMMNPEGCTSGNWIKLNTGTPDTDAAYQLLLAAYLSGRSIRYRVDGCSYYPVVYSLEGR